ncbi:MAG: c-type cytochrome [Acidobacteria bacterium]|nr:c-type cytochrome [Acidobacteriota bacterium]
MLENPYTSDADVAAGEKTFVSQCASCHGLGAKGGAGGPDLTTVRFPRASSDEYRWWKPRRSTIRCRPRPPPRCTLNRRPLVPARETAWCPAPARPARSAPACRRCCRPQADPSLRNWRCCGPRQPCWCRASALRW